MQLHQSKGDITPNATDINPSFIPDFWRIVHDPHACDERAMRLEYHREDVDEPVCTISVLSVHGPRFAVDNPESAGIDGHELAVEVRDEHGDLVEYPRLRPMDQLLYDALSDTKDADSESIQQHQWEAFADVEVAIARVYILTNQLPLAATRGISHREDTVEIRSPYRPLTRSAREELSDTVEIITELDSNDAGRNDGVVVDERPPEDILNRYELSVVRQPEVIFQTERGKPVEIYTNPDSVITDNEKAVMTPAEAAERATKSDRFTLIAGRPAAITGEE